MMTMTTNNDDYGTKIRKPSGLGGPFPLPKEELFKARAASPCYCSVDAYPVQMHLCTWLSVWSVRWIDWSL